MSTDRRLVAAATALLDSGGEEAVTLRAVALASGVSHNAPYKHFANRDALLAAVAMADFAALQQMFHKIRTSSASPANKLMKTVRAMLQLHRSHPARYGLLFGNQKIATAGGELKRIAGSAFVEYVAIVRESQRAKVLPNAPGETVASLLFATLHGLIAIESVEGMHSEKGLSGVERSMKAWFELISPG